MDYIDAAQMKERYEDAVNDLKYTEKRLAIFEACDRMRVVASTNNTSVLSPRLGGLYRNLCGTIGIGHIEAVLSICSDWPEDIRAQLCRAIMRGKTTEQEGKP